MAMSMDHEDRQWILDILEVNFQRVDRKFDEMKVELKAEMTSMENRLTTVINRRFGSLDMQQRANAANIASLRLDIDDLKDRMLRLEGHPPPEI